MHKSARKGLTMSEIKTLEQLNELYAEPSKRAQNKVLPALDTHAITLINHCPGAQHPFVKPFV